LAAEPGGDGFGAASEAVLAEHAVDVGTHGAVSEAEALGDFFVREAGSDQRQDLRLARAQPKAVD
jgi:hypothetical protein